MRRSRWVSWWPSWGCCSASRRWCSRGGCPRTPPTMSKQPPAFHTRLRLVRTERNVSRQRLADAVGVHYQTIGYIERGDYTPSLELVLRLARYFSLPVE